MYPIRCMTALILHPLSALHPAVCVCVCDDLYLLCSVVRMSRKHMGVPLIGMANQNAMFVTQVGFTKRFEVHVVYNEVSFSKISTDLCLQVAQMPKSRDLAIFMLTDRQNRLLYPLLRMHAG